MKILLVEDNEHSALFLSKALKKYNYQIEIATDGQTALELVRSFDYDLILLDVMLPELDGISVCSQLRKEGCQIPIMMVTAKDSTSDRVNGLEAGADEYVVKPCELSELMARIRALLRRGRELLPMVLTWENLQLDVNTNEVSYEKKRLHLTPKEYGLLEIFLRNPGKIFNRNELLDRIWSSSESPGEEAVTTQIKGLRQKLKAVGMKTDVIETVYGLGYRLREENTVIEENREESSSTLTTISSSSSTVEAEVLAIMTEAWQDFRESFLRERFDLFEIVLNNLSTGSSNINLLKQAQAEAHCLAGSLGSYGLPLGSKVSREIEMLLQTLITWRENATLLLNRLKKLIVQLKKILQEQAIDKDSETSSIIEMVLPSKNISAIAKPKKYLNSCISEYQFLSDNNQNVRLESSLEKQVETRKEIQEEIINRLQLFEELFDNLSIGIPDNQLIQQAQFEAHCLANSFGNYDLPLGSKVAREVEFLLQTLANWRQHTALLLNRFEKLIIWLKDTLQQQSYIPITSVLPQSSTRLLIVDSDTVLTERIKQEAFTHGLQVEVATNLSLAKSLIASHTPNVVLLDIALNNNFESGLDFLAQLVEEKPDVRVIVFTQAARLDLRVEVARFGAYTFLQKNTPVNEVLSKIKEAVHPFSTNKAKILIVDDDPLTLSHVETLLSPWELQVTTLQSSQKFWDTLEATNPDLLILDIEMPDFNGIELCKAVRNDSHWHKLPILFLSIHSDAKIVHQVYAVGADDYIKKPIVERELITRIFNRLERNK